jgi:uncharacterized protein (TIGR03435 family)
MERRGWSIVRIAIVISIVTAIIMAATGASTLRAQTAEFEVATVKANHTGSGAVNFPRLRNGILAAQNVSLSMLLQAAYDLSAARITGPEWLNSDRFDLAGKSPQGVPDGELMPMLQALLRDRFRIAVHRATKKMPVYEMIAAKGGVKMGAFDPARPPVAPRNRGGAVIIGTGTMPELAKMLAAPAGRTVLDRTALVGRYSYVLTFMPLSAQAPGSASDTAPPDFFAAVQQQLGLKLRARKDPVEILIVDHAERIPSEN